MISGFDLIFMICLSTGGQLTDKCTHVHVQSEDGIQQTCVTLAPEIIADWVDKHPEYEGYGAKKWRCLPYGTEDFNPEEKAL